MKKIIAKDLLDIKAVFLRPNEPFTWASGIKSPIYCDNRLTLSYPKVRKDVEQGLAQLVKDNFPDAECLMGTATAGIAHAALAADILDLPMGYVRGGAKSHGRNNRIEGVVKEGMKVVVVEDLISTGGSSLECVEALREAGCEVLGLIAIFTYGLDKATVNFENKLPKYMAYVDTNDMPYIEEFIEKYRLGTNTGMYMKSGFCKYPLYHFDKAILQKIDKKGVNLYESHNKESYEKGNDKL